MTEQPFLFRAVTGGDLKSTTMNALDWKGMFGGAHGDGLTEYDAYLAVSWVRRCVELRANAMSTIPIVITRNGETVENWEFLDQLPALLWKAEATLQVYGAGYWIKQRNIFGMDKWLRWLAPNTITPVISAEQGLTGFKRKLPNATPQNLSVKDVVYMWQPSLVAEVGPGPGWVNTALVPSQMSKFMGQHTAAFFERGAIPAVILSVDGIAPRGELDRLAAWWQRVMQGVKRAFETVAVNAKVEPKIIGYPTKDLAMTELSLLVRQQIATAAGVPQTMLEDASNFATAKEHHKSFYEETLVPEARLIEDALNEQVFKPQGLELKLDYQALDIFQQDEGERSAALNQLVAAGLPVDLAMEILGFDLPEGVTYQSVGQRIEQDNARKLAEAQENMRLQAEVRQPLSAPGERTQQRPQPSKAVRDELDRWKRKSLSALKGGESPDVAFETDVLGESEQKALHMALAGADCADCIKAAFDNTLKAFGDKVTPEGADEILPVPDTVRVTEDDIARALSEWDRIMPSDYRGLLDARAEG